MVKVTVRELKGRKAKLLVEETDPSLVNAIRRTLVADVPKMAIEDVTLYDNTSGLFDEIVAHRLGLIPIPTDLATFVPRAECTCKGAGCANCTLRYTLSKEGPTMVLSGDLMPENPAYTVPDPKIPIVELLENQRLILEVEAIIGNGKMHAKYQPVSGAGYKYYPSVTIDDRKIGAEEAKKISDSCPVDILPEQNGKLTVSNVEKCILCMNCVDTAAKLKGLTREQARTQGGIWVEGDPKRFLFHFETDGSHTAPNALQKAVSLLADKYDEFSKHVAQLK